MKPARRVALLWVAPFAAAGDGVAAAFEPAFSGGVTAVYQQELDGRGDDTSLSGDLRMELEAGVGTWVLYVEGATGTDADSIFDTHPEINADAGTVFDRDGNGHIQVSELHYSIDWGEGSELTLGQIDPAALIDRSSVANDENTQFLGTAFVNNLTIEFPDYTFGALYRFRASARQPEYTIMVTNADGIADSRSYRELLDFSVSGNGLFAAAAARWYLDGTEFEAGTWLRTDMREHLEDPALSSRNYGAYAVYDRLFGEQAISLRAGIANEDVSPVTRFASIAWRRSFDVGTLGLGYARILESSRARGATGGDTDHAELWYRRRMIADGLHGTLSLQYVANAGFDGSNITAQSEALLAGLRLDYAF